MTYKTEECRGQSLTEYAIVLTLVSLATMVFIRGVSVGGESVMPGFLDIVGDFYLRIVRLVSIPFP
jgi:hypothetical protein